MVKGDGDQPVLTSVKLSNHTAKHSDVFEVSSKGKCCGSNSSQMTPNDSYKWGTLTFVSFDRWGGGFVPFSFCCSNNGAIQDKLFVLCNQTVLIDFVGTQLFVDFLRDKKGSQKPPPAKSNYFITKSGQ